MPESKRTVPKEQQTMKVKVVQPDNTSKEKDEGATVKLVNFMTNPTDDQLPSMTFLSRQMSFATSMQSSMGAKNVFGDEMMPVTCPHCQQQFAVSLGYVDLPALWEKNYYRRQLSVNAEHADRLSRLAEMQITGTPDDDFTMGAPQ